MSTSLPGIVEYIERKFDLVEAPCVLMVLAQSLSLVGMQAEIERRLDLAGKRIDNLRAALQNNDRDYRALTEQLHHRDEEIARLKDIEAECSSRAHADGNAALDERRGRE